MTTTVTEEERIKAAYGRRHSDETVYSFSNPGHLFMAKQLAGHLIKTFEKFNMNPLGDKKILEIGCGTGGQLRELVYYGATPENLFGIELLQNAVDEAKKSVPDADIRQGNAENLTFNPESFDMVMQFTMFTSILDDRMKQNVAGEMIRVLKPTGIIMWYDYFVSKPTNRDVKGIGRGEITRLFPNCTFDFNRVTLTPPIARAVAPYSFLLCYLLEKVPFLRTHYLVIIKKKAS